MEPSQPSSPPPPQWDPQQPQQPQWTPPPQQPAGWGGPGYGGPPPRPLGVTLAGVFLIIMGVLWLLGGAACAVGGAAIVGFGNQLENGGGLLGAAAGVVFVLAIIAVVIGILQIASGAGVMGGRGWARATGIVVSIVAALFSFLGACGSLTATASDYNGTGSGIGGLVVGVLYALTAYALISARNYFAYRR
jgi:hypothetical protein